MKNYGDEHILAEHWRKLSGPERGEVFHRGYSYDIQTGQFQRHSNTRETKHFNHTVRGICGDCNNGWMSQLETKVKQMLAPVASPRVNPNSFSKLVHLNDAARFTLHRWAAKTSIVIDTLYADPRVATGEFATGVMDGLGPWPLATWMTHIRTPQVSRTSTRVTHIVMPDGLVEYRLCLFSIHHLLTITLMWNTDLTLQHLNVVGPGEFFGPTVWQAPMLPMGIDIPGPEVDYVKDAFDAFVVERLQDSLHRRGAGE